MCVVSSRLGQDEVAGVGHPYNQPLVTVDIQQLQLQVFRRLRAAHICDRGRPWLLAWYASHVNTRSQLMPLRAGVWSPLLSITLVRTVSFSIYQRSKYAIDDWIYQATGSSPLVIANTKGAYPTLSTVACFGLAGAGAGASITAIACTNTYKYNFGAL